MCARLNAIITEISSRAGRLWRLFTPRRLLPVLQVYRLLPLGHCWRALSQLTLLFLLSTRLKTSSEETGRTSTTKSRYCDLAPRSHARHHRVEAHVMAQVRVPGAAPAIHPTLTRSGLGVLLCQR